MAEAAVQPAETKPETLALSRRTVLVERETGFWAVLVFVISCIGLGYNGLLPFSTLAGIWPGANLAVIVIAGAVFFMLYAYTFAAIGALAPKYGADYVVASRVISPPLAFVSSWILVLFLGIWGGGLIAWTSRSLVPTFTRALSLVTFDKSLLSIADWAASPSGMITLGTLGVVLIFIMLIFPPRVTHWVLLVGVVLTIFAWVLVGSIFASAAPGDFETGWDHLMGGGSFLEHVLAARSQGLSINLAPESTLIAGLMVSLWLFSGSCLPTYFAREVKEPNRNLLYGSWVGLALSALVLAAVTIFVQRLVPLEWLAAESYLSQTAAFTGQTMPWLPFYALVLRPDAILVYLLGFTWILAMLNLTHTMLYAGCRILLAWGEDHLVPQAAMFLHPELRSPLITVLLICLLAEAGVVWAALTPAYYYRINPIFYIATAQFLPLLAVTLLPFLKRDWYQQARGIARYKIGPLPLVSLTGGLSLLYLVVMIAWLVSRLGTSVFNWETLLGFAIAFITGLVWFFGWRSALISQGSDIDGLYKRLPKD